MSEEWNALYREWEAVVLSAQQDEAEAHVQRIVERWNGAEGTILFDNGMWATVTTRAITLWEPEPRLGEPVIEVWATEAPTREPLLV